MASEVDWNSLGGTDQQQRGRINYIRFESGKMYSIRPVGKAVEFYKFFVQSDVGRRSLCVDIEQVEKAAEMLSEKQGKEIKPQHRYAMNVIDREDSTIKILEGGPMIFKFFANWAKGNNTHPGGMEGGNWQIQVQGDGLARKYVTGYLGPAPFSEDELNRIKKKGELYSLSEIYKGIELDNLIERAFGERDSGGPAPQSQQSEPQSEPQQTPQVQQPVAAGGGLSGDPISW